MGKRRRRKLSTEDREDIALQCSYGYDAEEIALNLGLAPSVVRPVYEAERKLLDAPETTLNRLLRQRRSVELHRNRTDRFLRRFQDSLPESQLAQAIRLAREVLAQDAELRHLDSEIAAIEAKDRGGDRPRASVVEIPVGAPELGDKPDDGGVSGDDGDGDGPPDDADQ